MLKVAREWAFHYRCWKTSVDPLEIRYEDLHADTRGVLERTLAHLGEAPDPAHVETALRSFAFESMSGGRKAGDEDAYHFYRKGIVGDHRNHFSRSDEWIMQQLSGEQMSSLGYSTRADRSQERG